MRPRPSFTAGREGSDLPTSGLHSVCFTADTRSSFVSVESSQFPVIQPLVPGVSVEVGSSARLRPGHQTSRACRAGRPPRNTRAVGGRLSMSAAPLAPGAASPPRRRRRTSPRTPATSNTYRPVAEHIDALVPRSRRSSARRGANARRCPGPSPSRPRLLQRAWAAARQRHAYRSSVIFLLTAARDFCMAIELLADVAEVIPLWLIGYGTRRSVY